MRGKVVPIIQLCELAGITPAYAGKRLYYNHSNTTRRDHPRVCGEKYTCSAMCASVLGSPPRMRGKGSFAILALSVSGITPAYAGKRACADLTAGSPRDHPRVCGEKKPSGPPCGSTTGSPPRMRGKASPKRNKAMKHGITPAYAGKRLLETLEKIRNQDHPRVCGEKSCVLLLRCRRPGSPPRMRGKGYDILGVSSNLRITPAYAGKRL